MNLDIETLVKQQVTHEFESLDLRGLVEDVVRAEIQQSVAMSIVQDTRDLAQSMIREEIRRFLDGNVETDDGWGKKASYDSFEDLFRATFKKSMSDQFKVKREIDQQVKARVDSLVKQDFSKVIEKIVDELTCSKLLKKGSQ